MSYLPSDPVESVAAPGTRALRLEIVIGVKAIELHGLRERLGDLLDDVAKAHFARGKVLRPAYRSALRAFEIPCFRQSRPQDGGPESIVVSTRETMGSGLAVVRLNPVFHVHVTVKLLRKRPESFTIEIAAP